MSRKYKFRSLGNAINTVGLDSAVLQTVPTNESKQEQSKNKKLHP